jgi:hypothetical protein
LQLGGRFLGKSGGYNALRAHIALQQGAQPLGQRVGFSAAGTGRQDFDGQWMNGLDGWLV